MLRSQFSAAVLVPRGHVPIAPSNIISPDCISVLTFHVQILSRACFILFSLVNDDDMML